MSLGTLTLLGLALLAFEEAPMDKAKDADKDQEKLQGRWELVETENGGKRIKPANDVRISFEKDVATDWCEGHLVTKSKFKTDSSKTPKRMTITILENRLNPKSKGDTFTVIYELDGDRLKLCYQDGRDDPPTDFITKENDGHTVYFYERVKR